MPKCPRNSVRKMFREQHPGKRLSSKADLLVTPSCALICAHTLHRAAQMYLNYVMFVEALAEKAAEAAAEDKTPMEPYHIGHVAPVCGPQFVLSVTLIRCTILQDLLADYRA